MQPEVVILLIMILKASRRPAQFFWPKMQHIWPNLKISKPFTEQASQILRFISVNQLHHDGFILLVVTGVSVQVTHFKVHNRS